ncbi:MAG: hypothetical protein R2843_02040 [Thermomicrobiales bacterium]
MLGSTVLRPASKMTRFGVGRLVTVTTNSSAGFTLACRSMYIWSPQMPPPA